MPLYNGWSRQSQECLRDLWSTPCSLSQSKKVKKRRQRFRHVGTKPAANYEQQMRMLFQKGIACRIKKRRELRDGLYRQSLLLKSTCPSHRHDPRSLHQDFLTPIPRLKGKKETRQIISKYLWKKKMRWAFDFNPYLLFTRPESRPLRDGYPILGSFYSIYFKPVFSLQQKREKKM